MGERGQKIKEEVTALALTMLYFTAFLWALLLVKTLILAEYRIEFSGWSTALVGALVLSKVVLVLERVSLGDWVRRKPALVDVLLRTMLYSMGVFLVLLLEKSFEGRHEYGGLAASLRAVVQHADIPHVWVNTICLSGAILGYNVLSVIRRRLGKGGLRRLLLTPMPEKS